MQHEATQSQVAMDSSHEQKNLKEITQFASFPW